MPVYRLGLVSLSFFLLVNGTLFAVPSPQEVLGRAAKGSGDFVSVTSEIMKWTQCVNASTQIYPYLTILDPLSDLAKGYGLNVEALASNLTHAAYPFLNLKADDSAVAQAFFKWSDDDLRFKEVRRQQDLVKHETDKAALLGWAAQAFSAEGWLDDADAYPEVADATIELQRLAVHRVLALGTDFTRSEMDALIVSAQSAPVLSELSFALQERVLSQSDSPTLTKLFDWTSALLAKTRSLSDDLPAAVLAIPGNTLVQCLFKVLSIGQVPAMDRIPPLMESLLPDQIITLATRLPQEYTGRALTSRQVDFLWVLSDGLKKKVDAMGLPNLSFTLTPFVRMLALNHLNNQNHIEGEYSVFIDGEPGTVTLAAMGKMQFVAGVDVYYDNGAVEIPFSLFNVTYNLDDQTLEAHYNPDTSPLDFEKNLFLKLHFSGEPGKNIIDGVFSNERGFHTISGSQTKPFPAFIPVASTSVNGTFEGLLGTHPITLILSQSGDIVSGAIRMLDIDQPIEFCWSFQDRLTLAIYLTTCDQDASGAWVQVRGQLVDDGKLFKGSYLVAGRGIQFDLNLGRVQ